jgi:hypothetical protein
MFFITLLPYFVYFMGNIRKGGGVGLLVAKRRMKRRRTRHHRRCLRGVAVCPVGVIFTE